MRGLTPTASALLGAFALVPPAAAEVFISVDKTTQRMTVSVDGQERYSWPVSTGMTGYVTPSGAFTPSHLKKQHYSREWDNAPMPHSIFFTGDGHAIHGSHVTGRLGMPASHGCVRLAPAHASTLFELVRAEGLGNTRIEVTGTDPVGGARVAGRSGGWRDYRGIVAFDPLSTGIMSGGSGTRLRSEPGGRP